MKHLLTFFLLVLATSTVWGQKATTRKAAPKAASAATAEDVKALRDALAAQQEQIQQLRQELQQRDEQWRAAQQRLDQATTAANEAQTKATVAETAANEQKESVSKLNTDVKDMQGNMTTAALSAQEDQKRVGAIEGLVNRFRFSGDVRVRYENFFQEGVADRHRERIRLRLGVQGKLNEDFLGGIFLATGTLANGAASLADPVSTNETLTGFFERKVVGFDRGWITYNPTSHKWLSLTGGKFAYTWDRTVMQFDNDLNPEGFAQKLSFDTKNPIFKNITFNGMQLMFNEASGGTDSFAAGGGASTKIQLAKWLTLTPSYNILNWRNADVIAQAASPATPLTGSAATRVFNANPMTNATRNCGAVASPNPECRAGGSAHREFVSKFLTSDFILNADIKTPLRRWPLKLTGEFLQNLNAENENPAAVGKQDTAFWGEAAFGQQKAKNDVQVGYSFAHVEQDALIGQFADSDFRAQTNVLQHRVYGQWRVKNNVTAAYTLFVGRTLNCRLQNAALASGFTCSTTGAGNAEPWLKRMQFDLIYSF